MSIDKYFNINGVEEELCADRENTSNIPTIFKKIYNKDALYTYRGVICTLWKRPNYSYVANLNVEILECYRDYENEEYSCRNIYNESFDLCSSNKFIDKLFSQYSKRLEYTKNNKHMLVHLKGVNSEDLLSLDDSTLDCIHQNLLKLNIDKITLISFNEEDELKYIYTEYEVKPPVKKKLNISFQDLCLYAVLLFFIYLVAVELIKAVPFDEIDVVKYSTVVDRETADPYSTTTFEVHDYNVITTTDNDGYEISQVQIILTNDDVEGELIVQVSQVYASMFLTEYPIFSTVDILNTTNDKGEVTYYFDLAEILNKQ